MPVYVPLDRVVDNPFNTRTVYAEDAVAELADSIERDSMLQTPVARLVVNGDGLPLPSVGNSGGPHELYRMPQGPPVGEGSDGGKATLHYLSKLSFGAPADAQLAFGHTRARAWRLIWERRADDQVIRADGLHGAPFGTMPVELRPLSDDAMDSAAWTENHGRTDLDPVDRAAAIAARIQRYGWTHAEAGEALGLERSTVSNILRWYLAIAGYTCDDGEPKLAAKVLLRDIRAGHVSESKARAVAGAFVAAAERREAYARAFAGQRDDELFYVAQRTRHDADAEATRERVAAFVAKLDAAELEIRQQREPSMFDLSKPEDRAAEAEPLTIGGEPLVNLSTGEAITAHGQMEVGQSYGPASRLADAEGEADGYDDGGRQLAAVAEAHGMQPFDQAEEREPTEAEHTYPGMPDWDPLERALVVHLHGCPLPTLRLLAYGLCHGYTGPEPAESIVELLLSKLDDEYTNAREVAEAWGVEVEWPDVSTDTPEAETPEPSTFDRLVSGDAELAATLSADELTDAFNRAADAHMVRPILDRIGGWIEEAERRETAARDSARFGAEAGEGDPAPALTARQVSDAKAIWRSNSIPVPDAPASVTTCPNGHALAIRILHDADGEPVPSGWCRHRGVEDGCLTCWTPLATTSLAPQSDALTAWALEYALTATPYDVACLECGEKPGRLCRGETQRPVRMAHRARILASREAGLASGDGVATKAASEVVTT